MSRTFARWLLSHCIAEDRRDAIIGDLEESALSDARYWKETIMAIAHESSRVQLGDIFRPLGFGLAGAALQIAMVVTEVNGPVVIFPYAMVVIVAAMYVRDRYPSSFAARFSAVLASFMCMTVVFYFALYSVITPRGIHNIPLFGHVWRLGFMLGIGIGAAMAIALLTRASFESVPRLLFVVALGALGTGAIFILGRGWPGFIVASLSVLGVAAAYIHVAPVPGFVARWLIVAVPFVFAIVALLVIQAATYHLARISSRSGYIIAAGCALSALVARFTPQKQHPKALSEEVR